MVPAQNIRGSHSLVGGILRQTCLRRRRCRHRSSVGRGSGGRGGEDRNNPPHRSAAILGWHWEHADTTAESLNWVRPGDWVPLPTRRPLSGSVLYAPPDERPSWTAGTRDRPCSRLLQRSGDCRRQRSRQSRVVSPSQRGV